MAEAKYIECSIRKCCYTCNGAMFKENKMVCMWDIAIPHATGNPCEDVCSLWDPMLEILKNDTNDLKIELLITLAVGNDVLVYHEDGTDYVLKSSILKNKSVGDIKYKLRTLAIKHGEIVKFEKYKD